MIIALNEKNEKVDIERAIKGEKYFCPLCKTELIQKHGTIKAPHFAHKHACIETWSGDMSPWHFWWQRQFPEDACECVFESEGQSHRTDVYLDKQKLVIEFQHSPIKREEFLDRNNFYMKLGLRVVWLFDLTSKLLDDKLHFNEQGKTLFKDYGFQVLKDFVFENPAIKIFFQIKNDGDLFNSIEYYNELKKQFPWNFQMPFNEFNFKNKDNVAIIVEITKQFSFTSFCFDKQMNKGEFVQYLSGLKAESFNKNFEIVKKYEIHESNIEFFNKALFDKRKMETEKSYEELRSQEPFDLYDLWEQKEYYRLRAINKLTGDVITIYKSPMQQFAKYGKVYGDIYFAKTKEYKEGIPIFYYYKKIWIKM